MGQQDVTRPRKATEQLQLALWVLFRPLNDGDWLADKPLP